MSSPEHKFTNALINETSPYLLQHAHNPVNWHPWNDSTLAKAKKENKLILISIGYSACHWCHVMEHESFEDEKVAQLMNDYFICIKVDREERPDIDQVYMLAVQLMTGRGGWPLNCFALPDTRPVYGGTYFPKQQWINVLFNLADTYNNDKDKVLDYANQLTEGVRQAELIKIKNNEDDFAIDVLHQSYKNWRERFDYNEGGPDKAPKFPLPNNYEFLLHYAQSLSLSEKEETGSHIHLTLMKMAFGGIYDQIGGGFSRYSVDHLWKVPHFEKMLYDNAQLVSLYCSAYQESKNNLYRDIVFETIGFVERELTSTDGGFYAALDADSEGEEGKYYVWKEDELRNILKEKYALAADYFNVNERGFWEHDNYILLRHDEDAAIAAKHNITVNELQEIVSQIKKELLAEREKRMRPGLDNKIITSWNALMVKAYVDAYNTFNDKKYLEAAIRNISFLKNNILSEGNKLSHLANGKAKISGFLEDYSFMIEALIALYEAAFDEQYLYLANNLMLQSINHFLDERTGLFYFTSDEDTALIARKMEVSDNVIPASNSSIAKSLFRLGHHLGNEKYISMSRRMLYHVTDELISYGAGYSNWGMLMLWFTQPMYEVVIVGNDVEEMRKEFGKHYLPNVIFAGSKSKSDLPLLKERFVENKTVIYICENKTCGMPVNNVKDALTQIRKN
jgi:hypothetical protein